MENKPLDAIQKRLDSFEGEINRRFIDSVNDFGKAVYSLDKRLSSVDKKLDKIDKRLEDMDQKLNVAIAGNQALVGLFSTIETLVLVAIRTRPKNEIESIVATWSQITAFETMEVPPAMKEAASKNYQDIKGFLEEALA